MTGRRGVWKFGVGREVERKEGKGKEAKGKDTKPGWGMGGVAMNNRLESTAGRFRYSGTARLIFPGSGDGVWENRSAPLSYHPIRSYFPSPRYSSLFLILILSPYDSLFCSNVGDHDNHSRRFQEVRYDRSIIVSLPSTKIRVYSRMNWGSSSVSISEIRWVAPNASRSEFCLVKA